MDQKANSTVRIDLTQFKLHIRIKPKSELTLHFDSPSRRFYLSVIALVLQEMKSLGQITSIPLEAHADTLRLLNETVGDSLGSSENLIPRIYRKWKDALPDLENAPLFKVVGRKKEEDGAAKVYRFSEAEKDTWANLFEYKGSEEHVRLRFSIDKLGAGLDDAVLVYENASNGDAWGRFSRSLKEKSHNKSSSETPSVISESPPSVAPSIKQPRLKRPAILAFVALVVAVAGFTLWHAYGRTNNRASIERMVLPLPDKPSIAVLPFVNMSADKEQELFSDGLTDTIITSLSKIPHLFVIASNSSFTYKGKRIKVQQVAEGLGVQYVLEGSVQRSDKRIRIRAQLVDAISGRHMWAETYDRELKDIFAIQDEITRNILTALQVELTSGEYARAMGKGTKSLEALQLVWKSQYQLARLNKEDNALARQYAEKALEIDPGFSFAWAELGFTHNYDSVFGWSSLRAQSLKTAEECAQKALSLNPFEPKAYLLLHVIANNKGETEKAVEYAQKALELNPNDMWAFFFLGRALCMVGRYEESIANIRKAMRLTPHYPAVISGISGWSSFFLRRYKDALASGEEAVRGVKTGEIPVWLGNILMVAIYSELGQQDKAHKFASEIMGASPKWNLEVFRRMFPLKNQSDMDRVVNAARKAGLN